MYFLALARTLTGMAGLTGGGVFRYVPNTKSGSFSLGLTNVGTAIWLFFSCSLEK